MSIIIQKRNQGSKSNSKKNRKKRNVNIKGALGTYSSHMKKVNKKMYG